MMMMMIGIMEWMVPAACFDRTECTFSCFLSFSSGTGKVGPPKTVILKRASESQDKRKLLPKKMFTEMQKCATTTATATTTASSSSSAASNSFGSLGNAPLSPTTQLNFDSSSSKVRTYYLWLGKCLPFRVETYFFASATQTFSLNRTSVSLPSTPSALDHLSAPQLVNNPLGSPGSKTEEKWRKRRRKERRGLNNDRWKFSAMCEANSTNVEKIFETISDYVICERGRGRVFCVSKTKRFERARKFWYHL